MASNVVPSASPLGGIGLQKLWPVYSNIGSLTGKSIELVKSLHKHRINIACVQETKWMGAKAREVDGYKLWYSGSSGPRMEWVFWSIRSWLTLLLR